MIAGVANKNSFFTSILSQHIYTSNELRVEDDIAIWRDPHYNRVSALGDQESVWDVYSLYIYLAPTAAFVGIIWTLIRLMDYFFPPRKAVNQYSSYSNIRILQLRRKASGQRLWNAIKVTSVVISVLMLLVVGLLIYATIKSGLGFSLAPLLVLAFLTALAVYLLAGVILDDKKFRKGAESRVAERAELELFGHHQSVLEQCRRALSAMGARIIHLDAEQGVIRAELRNNRVTFQITKIEDMHHHMSIISDAAWPTTRFDFGENKRIVNELIKML